MVGGSALPLAYFNYMLQIFGLVAALDRMILNKGGAIPLSKALTSLAETQKRYVV